jgi:hypothetical protein
MRVIYLKDGDGFILFPQALSGQKGSRCFAPIDLITGAAEKIADLIFIPSVIVQEKQRHHFLPQQSRFIAICWFMEILLS